MRRSWTRLLVAVGVVGLIVGVAGARGAAQNAPAASVTFTKDVLPILQKNCQNCHRPGQIGPMSLLDYQSARPWARAIRDRVVKREMPPWFADPQYGHFLNDRSLKQAEIDTLVKWADAGAPQGDPKDAPPPVNWPAEGWSIKPDVIVKGAPYEPKTSGIEPWWYVTMPTGFKEDTWVTSMEMRPGNDPSVIHHYCVYLTPHKADTVYGKFTDTPQGEGTSGGPFEGCYEKGMEAFDYRPQHAGRLIPANSDIVFQMHYAPNGHKVVDVPLVGFTLAKSRPARQYVFFYVLGNATSMVIPPNEPDYVAPLAEGELNLDAELIWLQGHAHYRAKQMTFDINYPDGRDDRVLRIHWNPEWQGLYYPSTPMMLPKGTRLHVEGRYDNSAGNKFNPNPAATVRWGQQATDEMLFPTFGVLVDSSIDLKKTPILAAEPRGRRASPDRAANQ